MKSALIALAIAAFALPVIGQETNEIPQTNEVPRTNILENEMTPEDYIIDHPEDITVPDGLFPVGKWMLDRNLDPASWLGVKLDHKSLKEPINIIIEMRNFPSEGKAVTNVVKLLASAGYRIRMGHSGGYFGYLAGRLFVQIPAFKHHAFSNEPFEVANNHGRLFGPVFRAGRCFFIGAFSREDVDPVTKHKHIFASFNQARDGLARRLDKYTKCRIKAYVSMNNAVIGDNTFTTGDHDGIAVWLSTTD